MDHELLNAAGYERLLTVDSGAVATTSIVLTARLQRLSILAHTQ